MGEPDFKYCNTHAHAHTHSSRHTDTYTNIVWPRNNGVELQQTTRHIHTLSIHTKHRQAKQTHNNRNVYLKVSRKISTSKTKFRRKCSKIKISYRYMGGWAWFQTLNFYLFRRTVIVFRNHVLPQTTYVHTNYTSEETQMTTRVSCMFEQYENKSRPNAILPSHLKRHKQKSIVIFPYLKNLIFLLPWIRML